VDGEQAPRCEFDGDQLVRRFEATIPGDVEAIAPVVERIMAVVSEMGCAAGHEFDVEVAVNEALANAVKHGCCHDPAKEIEILVECDPEAGMLIVVRDPGSGFDPTEVPSPVVGERLYADHGRGIYLINQLMDEVHYKRGGTEIWMRKR
jgi:serine/threonine-protein kinase RsbW